MHLRTLSGVAIAIGLTLSFAGAAAAQAPASCTPSFTPIEFNRGLPHAYAEQGLESIPLLFRGHEMLAQRRIAQAGPVSYSLLVYKKDAKADAVSIEGVGVHESRAWRFSATCASRLAWDGLVTTLERVAALPREPKPATAGKP